MVRKFISSLENGINVIKSRGIEINIRLGETNEYKLNSIGSAVRAALNHLEKFRSILSVAAQDADRKAGEEILKCVMSRLSSISH